MEQGKDPYTQEVFVKKRSNQRFANPGNRIRFNNLKARRKRYAKSFIDSILDRNRIILGKILGSQKEVTISKDYLLGTGFVFEYFSYQTTIDDQMYCGIYEFGIAKLTGNNYKIIRIVNE